MDTSLLRDVGPFLRSFILFCWLMTSCHLFCPLTPSYRALAKLTRLRIHVSYLLTSVLPHLELREIGFDSEQVDGILYTVLEANHILDWAPDYTLYIPFCTLPYSTLLYSTLLYPTLLYPTLLHSSLVFSSLLHSLLPPPSLSPPLSISSLPPQPFYALYRESLSKSWLSLILLLIQFWCGERG